MSIIRAIILITINLQSYIVTVEAGKPAGGGTTTTNTTSLCPIGWKPDTNDETICYKDTLSTGTYFQAVSKCKALSPNATLPIFLNATEETTFFNVYEKVQATPIWLGYLRKCPGKNLLKDFVTFDDRTNTVYTNWDYGDSQPDNYMWSENCCNFRYNGKWNDLPCSGSSRIVCQMRIGVEPPPVNPVTANPECFPSPTSAMTTTTSSRMNTSTSTTTLSSSSTSTMTTSTTTSTPTISTSTLSTSSTSKLSSASTLSTSPPAAISTSTPAAMSTSTSSAPVISTSAMVSSSTNKLSTASAMSLASSSAPAALTTTMSNSSTDKLSSTMKLSTAAVESDSTTRSISSNATSAYNPSFRTTVAPVASNATNSAPLVSETAPTTATSSALLLSEAVSATGYISSASHGSQETETTIISNGITAVNVVENSTSMMTTDWKSFTISKPSCAGYPKLDFSTICTSTPWSFYAGGSCYALNSVEVNSISNDCSAVPVSLKARLAVIRSAEIAERLFMIYQQSVAEQSYQMAVTGYAGYDKIDKTPSSSGKYVIELSTAASQVNVISWDGGSHFVLNETNSSAPASACEIAEVIMTIIFDDKMDKRVEMFLHINASVPYFRQSCGFPAIDPCIIYEKYTVSSVKECLILCGTKTWCAAATYDNNTFVCQLLLDRVSVDSCKLDGLYFERQPISFLV